GAVVAPLDEAVVEQEGGDPVAGEEPPDPRHELLHTAPEGAVVVDGIGVVAGPHQVEVDPVDAPAVPEQHVADLAVGGPARNGVEHRRTVPRGTGPAVTIAPPDAGLHRLRRG